MVVAGNASSSAQQPSLLPEALVGQPASQAATLSQGQSHQPPVVIATVQPAVLASPAMDQLISQVTDEVTKRLQPLLSNLSSMVQQTQSTPPHHLKNLWNSIHLCSPLDPTPNKSKDLLPSRIQLRCQLFMRGSSQF